MKSQIDNFPNHTNQFMAAIAANLVFLAHGSMIGWMSPATPILMSNSTPLKSGPLTNEQLSWLGSINTLGAIFSALIFGSITTFFGCKRAIHLLFFPSTLFYVLIYFGDTYYHLLIARFLTELMVFQHISSLFTGINGGGMQITIIIYIADIASNKIRGRLGSISHLSRNIGILTSFIFGWAMVPYDVVPCIFIFIPIVFAIWFTFIPNTPQQYLKNGNVKKAENALRFYKNAKNRNDVEKSNFKAEFERLKSLASEQKVEEKIQLKDVFNRSALIGIINGSILASFGHLTGYLVLTTYAVVIFKEAGATNINPHVSSVSLAVLQLIGNLCTTALSDTLGRRALLIISLFGSALGTFTFALYCYLRSISVDVLAFEWVPVVALGVVILFASAGVVPLMFVNMIEHIPSKIRTIGVTICNVIMNMIAFGILKIFPILMASIGLYAAVGILSIFSGLGTIYVFIAIKETKGMSLDTQKQPNHCTQNPESGATNETMRY